MTRNLIAHRPVRLRQYRYPGEHPGVVVMLGILLSVYAAMAIFFPYHWSTTRKAVFFALAGIVMYLVGVILQRRAFIGTRGRTLGRLPLGECIEERLPEKHGIAEKPQSQPETLQTAIPQRREFKLLAALNKSLVNDPSIAKPGSSVSQRTERDTVFDEDIAIEDGDFTKDDNDFDPRMFLAGVEGDYPVRRLRTRIGRDLDNDIVLDSDRISRYHVELQRRDGVMMVIDKKSRTGVWLNGRRVREPKPIRSGDLLRIGRIEFTFHLKEQKSR